MTTHFYRGSSSHLLYHPSKFDDPENDALLEAAIKDYEKAIELSRKHCGEFEMLKPYQQYGMEQLAAIYRDNLDDFGNAEKYFKSLIEFDPKTPERYYALADVYERFHDPEELPLLEQAIEAYKKPVDLAPSDPLAYRQVANLLNKYGRFDETMEWLGKARDVQATNPEGYYLIAVHYWDKVYRDPDLTTDDKKAVHRARHGAARSGSGDRRPVRRRADLQEPSPSRAGQDRAANARPSSTAMANELRDRAMVLREQQQAAEKAAAAAASEGAEKGAAPDIAAALESLRTQERVRKSPKLSGRGSLYGLAASPVVFSGPRP